MHAAVHVSYQGLSLGTRVAYYNGVVKDQRNERENMTHVAYYCFDTYNRNYGRTGLRFVCREHGKSPMYNGLACSTSPYNDAFECQDCNGDKHVVAKAEGK